MLAVKGSAKEVQETSQLDGSNEYSCFVFSFNFFSFLCEAVGRAANTEAKCSISHETQCVTLKVAIFQLNLQYFTGLLGDFISWGP